MIFRSSVFLNEILHWAQTALGFLESIFNAKMRYLITNHTANSKERDQSRLCPHLRHVITRITVKEQVMNTEIKGKNMHTYIV